MTPTEDEIHPLGAGGAINWVAVAKGVRKAIPVIVPAIVAIATSLVTVVSQVRIAVTDAKSSAKVVAKDVGQVVKNKSEAGYQELKAAVEAYDVRLAAIERRFVEVPKKGKRRPALPLPVRKLPADLDQAAARQTSLRLVAPAPVPAHAQTPDALP